MFESVEGEVFKFKAVRRRLFVPVLMVCGFLTWGFTAFYSTLLIDIAASFNVSIGIASQVLTVTRLTGLLFSLIIGFLTLRFNHKFLLIFGLMFFASGTLGCFLTDNFGLFFFFQLFLGIGFVTVAIISLTLIGDFLPIEKRGLAIGLTVSAGLFAFVIVPPLSSYFLVFASWRSILSWFMLPLTSICVLLCLLSIPGKPQMQKLFQPDSTLRVFKNVLSNPSAIACVGSLTLLAFLSSVPIFAVSFYRLVFFSSPITAATYSTIAAVGGVIGAVIGGKLVNRVGRKALGIITAFLSSILTIVFTLVPNEYVSVSLWATSACTLSMNLASLHSLVLEQIPENRGTMMAIENSFRNAGLILSVTVGGFVLQTYANNFNLLMIIFGSTAIFSVPILLLKAKDPT
jgi:MFS transporter, DHA1 family, inner membrane transport protein